MKDMRYKLLIKFCYLFLMIQMALTMDMSAQTLAHSAYNVYMPSPQTWDFMQYGNIPVRKYTGQLDMQIPLYHYSDPDFDVPISIGYNSAGFIPGKPPGPVGLNWFLNCGGMITRQVQGVPDDQRANSTIYHGMLCNFDTRPHVDNNNIGNFQAGQMALTNWFIPGTTGNQGYETTSDLFSFNFMGHSGNFMVDFNRNIHVFDCNNSGTYQIDLSGVSIQDYQSVSANSEITITTGDGYKYIFGGDSEYLEFCYSLQDSPEAFPTGDYIVSWYLKKIEAPNGRKIHFFYDGQYNSSDPHLYEDLKVVTAIPYETLMYTITPDGMSSDPGSVRGPLYQVIKTSYLTHINIDGICMINFEYSDREHADFEISQSLKYSCKQLNAMKVTNQLTEDITEEITFNYTYYGSMTKRLFLTSIRGKQLGKYQFEYQKTSYLPSFNTNSIDYWGFWNDHANGNTILPNIEFDNNGDIVYGTAGANRNPNPDLCDVGLLNKVIYPTGGSTSVAYEPHEYSQRLERKKISAYLPALQNISGTAGGARVRMIFDKTESGEENIREFYYKKSLNSSESSGILMHWTYMLFLQNGETVGGISIYRCQYISSGLAVNCFDSEYICYSHVVEHIKNTKQQQGNGYKETLFSNYNDWPDNIIDQYTEYCRWAITADDPDFNGMRRNQYRQMNSRKPERGLIKKEITYNENTDTLLIVNHKYRRADNYGIYGVKLSGDQFYSYRIFAGSPLLLEKTTLTHNPGGNNQITHKEEYTYNAKDQTKTTTTWRSDQKKICISYTYPHELSGEIYNKMVGINLIAPVVQKQITLIDGSSQSIIDAEHISFKAYTDNIIKPDTIKKLETSAPITLGTNYSGKMKPVTYYKYNTKDRIVEIRPVNGPAISYVWGYKNRYPIAKIENCDSTVIWQKLGAAKLTYLNNTPSDQQIHDTFENLRIDSDMNQSLIFHYTYKPLVGITSETDPAGHTTYYEYDYRNRLYLIKDHNGHIMENYQYRYINQ